MEPPKVKCNLRLLISLLHLQFLISPTEYSAINGKKNKNKMQTKIELELTTQTVIFTSETHPLYVARTLGKDQIKMFCFAT